MLGNPSAHKKLFDIVLLYFQPHFYDARSRLLPVLHNRELSPRSDRSTREIALSLVPFDKSGGPMTYTTGWLRMTA